MYTYGLSGEQVIPEWNTSKSKATARQKAEAMYMEKVAAAERRRVEAREDARSKAKLDAQLVGAPIDETALEFMDIVALWRLAGLKSGITKADLRFFQTCKKPSSLVLMAAQALRITLCPSLSLPAPSDLRWPNLNAWMLSTREILKSIGRTESVLRLPSPLVGSTTNPRVALPAGFSCSRRPRSVLPCKFSSTTHDAPVIPCGRHPTTLGG